MLATRTVCEDYMGLLESQQVYAHVHFPVFALEDAEVNNDHPKMGHPVSHWEKGRSEKPIRRSCGVASISVARRIDNKLEDRS